MKVEALTTNTSWLKAIYFNTETLRCKDRHLGLLDLTIAFKISDLLNL